MKYSFVSVIRQASSLGESSVYIVDLDIDGDIDVLADASLIDMVIWFENNGLGVFSRHDITDKADRAFDFVAADLDGDGDLGMVSASADEHKIAWYENNGKQVFSSHTITSQAIHAFSVDAADIDVFSTSQVANSINWYENQH
jgi:hypothetical protein